MIIPGIDRFRSANPLAVWSAAELPSSSSGKDGNSKAEIVKLDNGLTIITQNNPNVHSAGVNVFVNVGSVFENEKNNGATHFLEHMVFKRTKSKTGRQIAEEAEDSGASINAATHEDFTRYHTQTLGENIAVPTLSYLDMLLNSKILEKEFQTEKGVILEEAKMYEDNPQARVMYLAQETYFKGHPYGRRILGTQKTISEMQRSDLKQFLKDFYNPDNMFVSLVGNFDTGDVIRKIESFTSQNQGKTKKQEIPPLPVNVENAFDTINIQQAHVVLFTKGYSLLDDKRYTLLVLNQAFGGGISSRLFQNVREKSGYCYTVDSQPESTSFGGAFIIYSGLKKDKVQNGVDLILNEIKKLKKDGLKPHELKRAKTQIRTALLLREESTSASSFSNALGYMSRGYLTPVEETDQKIKSVTNEDIIRVANEIFAPGLLAAYVVGPKKVASKKIEINL